MDEAQVIPTMSPVEVGVLVEGPSVSVTLGLTLPIPGLDYGMVKPEVALHNISSGPVWLSVEERTAHVAPQIEAGLMTASQVMDQLDSRLEEHIARFFAVTGPTNRDRLGELEADIAGMRDRINKVVGSVNGVIEKVRPLLADRVVAEVEAANAEG